MSNVDKAEVLAPQYQFIYSEKITLEDEFKEYRDTDSLRQKHKLAHARPNRRR